MARQEIRGGREKGGGGVGDGAGIWVKALLLCLGGVRGARDDEENYGLEEEEEKTCKCAKTLSMRKHAQLPTKYR